jgi:hypothetical protein
VTRRLHRIGLIILGWVLLSGDAFVSCSSDPGNLGSSNGRPIASDGFYTTSVSNSVVGFMQATDPDGDDLTYQITAVPQLGSLQNVDFSTGQFTYAPRDAGTDSFSFRASDGRLESNTGVVTIRIDSETVGKASSAAVVDLQRDPLVPDSLLILWGDSAGTLQRISRQAASAPVTLASGVRSFAADPLRPGSMWVLAADGGLLKSVDGGTTWTDGEGMETSPCRGGELTALAADAVPVHCMQSDRHAGMTQLRIAGDAAWPVLQASHDGGISWQPIAGPDLRPARIVTLRRQPLIASEWWLAISAATTSVLRSADDGLSWTRVLDLPMADLTLVDCAPDTVCLMDTRRSQLWRYSVAR